MESHVPEKRIKVEVFLLFGRNDKLSDRQQNLVELSLHGVTQLQTACTFQRMYPLVVRQVDGNGLASRVTVAGIVHCIIHIQVGRGTRHKGFIFRRTGQLFLKGRKHGYELGQFLAAGFILQQDKRLVRSLGFTELIIVSFNRSCHEVNLAVLHVHPCQVTGQIIISLECFDTLFKVGFQARVLCQCHRFLQQSTDTFYFRGIGFMIPYALWRTVFVAADNRVP